MSVVRMSKQRQKKQVLSGIIGNGTETYLYLNGIRPSEATVLSEGVVLLPATCNPDPDDIIRKSQSELDIGVACIFLRSVRACFHITADCAKDLAVRAWNAQWDAVLLSALHDCEIGHTFQAEVPPEDFAKSKDFHITNYAFRGLNGGKPKAITPAKHRWLSHHYISAKNLLDVDGFMNAAHCLSSYRWHTMPRIQLAVLWSGIEGLFGVDNELSFRLSQYIARFLCPRNKARQRHLFNSVKKLYAVRSKAVHGSKIKTSDDAVRQSMDLLRRLVVKCAENGSIPSTDMLAP